MRIIALETSTECCSVALWQDGDIDARDALAAQRHSAVLLEMVDGLLRRHGVSVARLDGVAFGAGPGSFTGLRIACGVAQGLAFGAALPVAGVSTLLAMAEMARAERVLCCLDARMDQVYYAAYERVSGAWTTVLAPGLCAPRELPDLPGAGDWTGCGGGFRSCRAAIESRYTGRWSAILPDVYPHASAVARLAIAEFTAGRAVAAEAAAPVYIRDKVALRIDER